MVKLIHLPNPSLVDEPFITSFHASKLPAYTRLKDWNHMDPQNGETMIIFLDASNLLLVCNIQNIS